MLEVGRIAAKLGFTFDDDGADKWERRHRDLKGKARAPIVGHAKLDVDGRDFDKLDREMRQARTKAGKPIKADADLDVDKKGFRDYDQAIDRADRSTHQLDRSSGRLRGGIGVLGKTAGAAAAGGFLALGLGAKKAWDEFEEAAKIGAVTEARIKSTGGAANVTAKQVGDLSTELSNKAGIDDEVIQSGSNMLLTFKDIRNEAGKGNDVFNQANATLVDMAAALGKDPQTAAISLGKALNDPVKGITALSRVGVQFTDQQKKTIESLVESGDKMGAQKIILRELNTEFGGTAEAQARPLDRAKVSVLNLFEAIGNKLAPGVEKAATILADFIGGLTDGTGPAGNIARLIGKAGDAAREAADWIRDFGDAFLGGERGSKRFGKSTTDALGSVRRTAIQIFNTVKGALRDFVGAFSGAGDSFKIIGKAIGTALQFGLAIVRRQLPAIRQIIGGLATFIRGVVDVIAGILTLDFGRIWQGVKGIVGGAVKVIIGSIRQTTAPFREVMSRLGGVVGSGLRKVVGFFADLPGDIARWLRSAVTRIVRWNVEARAAAARAAIAVVKAIIDKVRDLPGDIWRWLRSAVTRIVRWSTDARQAAARAAASLVKAIIDKVRDLPGDVWSWLKRTLTRIDRWADDIRGKAIAAASGFVRGLINRIKDLPGDVWNWLVRTSDKGEDFVRNMGKKAASAGQAVLSGIGDKLRGLPNQVMGYFQSLLDRMTKIPGKMAGVFTGVGRKMAGALKAAANALIPDEFKIPAIRIKGHRVSPEITIKIPQLAEGGRVGPTAGGARLFIAGEGGKDEWVISQEGDRRQNIHWARQALEQLTGRTVGMHRMGAGPGTTSYQGATRKSTAITNRQREIELAQRALAQKETKFNISEEQLVVELPDGSSVLNTPAINARGDELHDLAIDQDKISVLIRGLYGMVSSAIGAWSSARRLLVKQKKTSKRKYRQDIQDAINEASTTLQDLQTLRVDIGGTDGNGGEWYDSDLQKQGYLAEEGAVRGTPAPPTLGGAAPERFGPDSLSPDEDTELGGLLEAGAQAGTTADTADDATAAANIRAFYQRRLDRGGLTQAERIELLGLIGAPPDAGTGTGPGTPTPSVEDIAASAAAALQTFVAGRQELLATFGGNTTPAGQDPFASELAVAGGVRAFGAAGGGADRPNITINNNFATGPGDEHGWVHRQAFQAEAKWS